MKTLKTKISLIITFIVIMSFTNCKKDIFDDSYKKFSFSGTVYVCDEFGNILDKSNTEIVLSKYEKNGTDSVLLESETIITDTTGNYRFENLKIKNDSILYFIEVNKPNFDKQIINVSSIHFYTYIFPVDESVIDFKHDVFLYPRSSTSVATLNFKFNENKDTIIFYGTSELVDDKIRNILILSNDTTDVFYIKYTLLYFKPIFTGFIASLNNGYFEKKIMSYGYKFDLHPLDTLYFQAYGIPTRTIYNQFDKDTFGINYSPSNIIKLTYSDFEK